MRQHKHMAQTGHALAHKTWFCHDPGTRLEKSKTWWQNQARTSTLRSGFQTLLKGTVNTTH